MSVAVLLLGFLPLLFWIGPDSDVEDSRETDGAHPGDWNEALQPVQEDDTAQDGTTDAADDLLAPFLDDDEPDMTMPPKDTGLPPMNDIGSDGFWINFDETAGTNIAELSGFDVDTDVLDVVIDPASVKGQINISFRPVPGSGDVRLFVEGEPIAIFRDVGRLDAGNVNVIVAVL